MRIERITEQPNGTYTVHFREPSVYPAFGGYDSIDAAKAFVRRTIAHRVVFIHLLPRTW